MRSWLLMLCLAVLALVSLPGCSSYSPAESAQLLTASVPPGRGVVFIGRPGGWNVSYVPLSIELNDRSLAQLSVNTYTRVELPPGTYKIAAPNTYITRVTYGTPRPLHLKVDAGKSYYVLPTRALENERQALNVTGTTVVVGKTGDVFGGFAIKETSGHSAPPEFAQLSYVAPEANAASGR